VEDCNTDACPVVDCETSPWSQWSECSKSCGTGHQQRVRVVTKEAQNGGKACGELQ